jgi:hypothetical protein
MKTENLSAQLGNSLTMQKEKKGKRLADFH